MPQRGDLTRTVLIPDLKLAWDVSDDPIQRKKIKEIIHNADEGVYDDFDTDLAFPKHQLRADLFGAGLLKNAQSVIEGRYG